MNKDKIILATDSFGNEITIRDVNQWISDQDKMRLSKLLYDRLYGRYIKPFDYNKADYRKNYKNGFAIMASCCLLIETYASFTQAEFLNTTSKSERCFGWFFNSEERFSAFSKGGLTTEEYLDLKNKINNKGLPKDFYVNVRCGILHNAETRNGWKITRTGEFFDETNKQINATKFMDQLKEILIEFQNKLINADIKSPIWENYLNRLEEIIKNS